MSFSPTPNLSLARLGELFSMTTCSLSILPWLKLWADGSLSNLFITYTITILKSLQLLISSNAQTFPHKPLLKAIVKSSQSPASNRTVIIDQLNGSKTYRLLIKRYDRKVVKDRLNLIILDGHSWNAGVDIFSQDQWQCRDCRPSPFHPSVFKTGVIQSLLKPLSSEKMWNFSFAMLHCDSTVVDILKALISCNMPFDLEYWVKMVDVRIEDIANDTTTNEKYLWWCKRPICNMYDFPSFVLATIPWSLR